MASAPNFKSISPDYLNSSNSMLFQLINQPRHKCRYRFQGFQIASDFAKLVASRLGEDVQLIPAEEGYIVKFLATWAEEKELIENIQSGELHFRSGSQCSIAEAKLIFEMFATWMSCEDFENVTRRIWGDVLVLLEGMGVIASFPENTFTVNYKINENDHGICPFYGLWEDGFDSTKGLSETLVLELQRLEVLPDASRFFVDEIDESVNRNETDEDIYIRLSLLDQQDCSNIYSYLSNLNMWGEIFDFSKSRGDSLINLRTFRRTNGGPLDFLNLLDIHEGLPCDLLYQKQLLSAYRSWYYSCEYVAKLNSWIVAAKKRVYDIYANSSSEFPGRVPFSVSAIEKNPIAAALDSAGSIELAMRGNRFAAAILADEYRIKSRQSRSRFNSDIENWSAIQEGYWPDEIQIFDAFLEYRFYDKKYAKKMEHLAKIDI